MEYFEFDLQHQSRSECDVIQRCLPHMISYNNVNSNITVTMHLPFQYQI